jgi:hypothetical protein
MISTALVMLSTKQLSKDAMGRLEKLGDLISTWDECGQICEDKIFGDLAGLWACTPESVFLSDRYLRADTAVVLEYQVERA